MLQIVVQWLWLAYRNGDRVMTPRGNRENLNPLCALRQDMAVATRLK
jgi:hypothetical protein